MDPRTSYLTRTFGVSWIGKVLGLALPLAVLPLAIDRIGPEGIATYGASAALMTILTVANPGTGPGVGLLLAEAANPRAATIASALIPATAIALVFSTLTFLVAPDQPAFDVGFWVLSSAAVFAATTRCFDSARLGDKRADRSFVWSAAGTLLGVISAVWLLQTEIRSARTLFISVLLVPVAFRSLSVSDLTPTRARSIFRAAPTVDLSKQIVRLNFWNQTGQVGLLLGLPLAVLCSQTRWSDNDVAQLVVVQLLAVMATGLSNAGLSALAPIVKSDAQSGELSWVSSVFYRTDKFAVGLWFAGLAVSAIAGYPLASLAYGSSAPTLAGLMLIATAAIAANVVFLYQQILVGLGYERFAGLAIGSSGILAVSGPVLVATGFGVDAVTIGAILVPNLCALVVLRRRIAHSLGAGTTT